jgi:hypothetical protein
LVTASIVNWVRGTIFIRAPFNYYLMKTLWHSCINDPVKQINCCALSRPLRISLSLYLFSNRIESNSSMMNVVFNGSNFYLDTIGPVISSKVQKQIDLSLKTEL